MDYSHEDRLEALQNLYLAVSDSEKDLYEAKGLWEKISPDIDESYFWMAVDDSYRNDFVDIQGDRIEPDEFELPGLELPEQEWRKIEVSRGYNSSSRRAPVYTDHFFRRDDPEIQLGHPVSEMVVTRDIEKGEKTVRYEARNNAEQDLWIGLSVEFTVPELSPEVEELFESYANDYLGKIWDDEMRELNERPVSAVKDVSA